MEANNIDEQALDVKKAQEFLNKQEIMESILNYLKSMLKHWEFLGVRFKGLKKDKGMGM